MKYSIIIPTYNHCDDFLKPCIDSIIQHTNLDEIELIVSANGCVDNTKQYLDDLQSIIPNLKIVWNDLPLGYTKATNEGIKVATTNKIVLLNNDCVLLPQTKNEWLVRLEEPFKNSDCGISNVLRIHSKETRKDFAVFFCVMIDKKVFDAIGLLNEECETGGGEDIEFCILAERKGFKIYDVVEKKVTNSDIWVGDFPLYHKGEGTMHDENLVKNWPSKFLRNSFRLARKYNEEWNKTKKRVNRKIAVITPTYNDVDKMFQNIDCVKTQTINNVYHYIFDDASTDDLKESMKSFSDDETIKYFVSNENKGQSYGRNFLISKAVEDGCDFIAFLDSDDVFHSDHLEKSLMSVDDNDIVYSTPNFVDRFGNKLFAVNIPVPDIFIGKQLLHNNFIWISSVVAKKECFLNNKFDTELNSIEDWEMWIQLYKQNFKFVKKNEVSVNYLVKDGGQASGGNLKMPLLKQKHKMLNKLKLNLACGHNYEEDYINVDFYAPDDAVYDVGFDVSKLPLPDNSVDEIKAFHIIEHFDYYAIREVLKEWHRVLKPGGRLWLETPDFLESCRAFVEGSPSMPIDEWRTQLYAHFFALPWLPGQVHKFLFTEKELRANLELANFERLNRLPPASGYVRPDTYHIFLNMEAFKK